LPIEHLRERPAVPEFPQLLEAPAAAGVACAYAVSENDGGVNVVVLQVLRDAPASVVLVDVEELAVVVHELFLIRSDGDLAKPDAEADVDGVHGDLWMLKLSDLAGKVHRQRPMGMDRVPAMGLVARHLVEEGYPLDVPEKAVDLPCLSCVEVR
jgi:hypothetical protein